MSSSETKKKKEIVNVNIGILGHVDSGKTSLCRVLSQKLSTCALDKIPISQERGMTIDLGFSAFGTEVPEHLSDVLDASKQELQYTLVDCPGHASLIRTILGGAQIIDLMVLVIDGSKGIQAQTAECIVIGEILSDNFVVVVNKMDLLGRAGDEREKAKSALLRKLRATFAQTKLGADVPIVCVSANSKKNTDSEDSDKGTIITEGIDTLVQTLAKSVTKEMVMRTGAGGDASTSPEESKLQSGSKLPLHKRPFVMSVDHCFRVTGRGTVMTGTILQGTLTVGQSVEICGLGQTRSVKSIESFSEAVTSASAGDRVGICVTKLDPKLLSRGVIAEEGHLHRTEAVIADASRVRFFSRPIKNGAKFHVTVGHTTCTAQAFFFTSPTDAKEGKSFDINAEYAEVLQLPEESTQRYGTDLTDSMSTGKTWYVLLLFSRSVICSAGSPYICSRLEHQQQKKNVQKEQKPGSGCRIAFSGHILTPIKWKTADDKRKLRVYRIKERRGIVSRKVDDRHVVVRCMFPSASNVRKYVGLKCVLGEPSLHQQGWYDNIVNDEGALVHPRQLEMMEDPENPAPKFDTHVQHFNLDRYIGKIEGDFGPSGKFIMVFNEPMPSPPVGKKPLITKLSSPPKWQGDAPDRKKDKSTHVQHSNKPQSTPTDRGKTEDTKNDDKEVDGGVEGEKKSTGGKKRRRRRRRKQNNNETPSESKQEEVDGAEKDADGTNEGTKLEETAPDEVPQKPKRRRRRRRKRGGQQPGKEEQEGENADAADQGDEATGGVEGEGNDDEGEEIPVEQEDEGQQDGVTPHDVSTRGGAAAETTNVGGRHEQEGGGCADVTGKKKRRRRRRGKKKGANSQQGPDEGEEMVKESSAQNEVNQDSRPSGIDGSVKGDEAKDDKTVEDIPETGKAKSKSKFRFRPPGWQNHAVVLRLKKYIYDKHHKLISMDE